MGEKTKQAIRINFRLLITCIYVAMSIYVLVVIEDYFQNQIVANPDFFFKLIYGAGAITFFGLIIFSFVKMSKPFGNILLSFLGLDLDEESHGAKINSVEENKRESYSYRWNIGLFGIFLIGSGILIYTYRTTIYNTMNLNNDAFIGILELVSIIIAFAGVLIFLRGFKKPPKNNTQPPGFVISNPSSEAALLKEYELSQDMHNYYGKIIWEIASIFIGGGFAAIGVVASQVTQPTPLVLLFSIAFTVLMLVFFLNNRRWRELAEVHLARCRQIEDTLGLSQHKLAKLSNEPSGVEITGSHTKNPLKVPAPSGWGTMKWLIIGLVTVSWIIGIVRLFL